MSFKIGARFHRLQLGTIHLRRRQIFMIFDPYPPPVGNHRHSSKMPAPLKRRRRHLTICPPPTKKNPRDIDTIFTDQTKGLFFLRSIIRKGCARTFKRLLLQFRPSVLSLSWWCLRYEFRRTRGLAIILFFFNYFFLDFLYSFFLKIYSSRDYCDMKHNKN